MKKLFSKIIITVIFAFAIMILSSHNSEASVTANISASPQYPKVGDTVTISWSSTGADSCSNNFNGSTSVSGFYSYTANSAGSQTFSVSCLKRYATTTSCFGGFYETNDPQHPNGGVISYTNPNGTPGSRSYIWIDDAVYIEYRTANGYSIVGGARGAGACN